MRSHEIIHSVGELRRVRRFQPITIKGKGMGNEIITQEIAT